MLIIITLIICISIISIIAIIYYYKSPQQNCNHELDTLEVRNSKLSSRYLSTCRKCGYQTTHIFTDLN